MSHGLEIGRVRDLCYISVFYCLDDFQEMLIQFNIWDFITFGIKIKHHKMFTQNTDKKSRGKSSRL